MKWCGIGTLVVIALLAVAGTVVAHTYEGKTVKRGDIHFRVGPNNNAVISLRAERELRCRKGRVRSFRRGAFRQVKTFVRSTGGNFFRGSIRTRGSRGSLVRLGRFSIRFVVDGARGRGVFRERVRLRGGTRCTSGRVRFNIPLIDTNDR